MVGFLTYSFPQWVAAEHCIFILPSKAGCRSSSWPKFCPQVQFLSTSENQANTQAVGKVFQPALLELSQLDTSSAAFFSFCLHPCELFKQQGSWISQKQFCLLGLTVLH